MDFDWGDWDWDPDFPMGEDWNDRRNHNSNRPDEPEHWDDTDLEGGY